MKIEIIVGNPPYQDNTNAPMYNLFMDNSYTLSEKVILVTPARFLFHAGRTSKSWNTKILEDEHFHIILYKHKSFEIFPYTDIKGGIIISIHDTTKRFVRIGTFYAYPELKSIAEKVNTKCSLCEIIWNASRWNLENIYKDFPEYKNKITSVEIQTNSLTLLPLLFHTDKREDDYSIMGLEKTKRVRRYINKKYIEFMYENTNCYKILVPAANSSGILGEVLSSPIIGKPIMGGGGDAFTMTFISIGSFETEYEAQSCLKYVKTKFARTLLSILKSTQHNARHTWRFVPIQNFTEHSDIDWNTNVAEIDKQLYKKYALNETEIYFIESKVKAMD